MRCLLCLLCAIPLPMLVAGCGQGERLRHCWQEAPTHFNCTATGLVAFSGYPADLRPSVTSDFGCTLEVRFGKLEAVPVGAMCANENWENYDFGADRQTVFSRDCGMPPIGDYQVQSWGVDILIDVHVTDAGMTCN